MHSAKATKLHGIDINRYLGIATELPPEDYIVVPPAVRLDLGKGVCRFSDLEQSAAQAYKTRQPFACQSRRHRLSGGCPLLIHMYTSSDQAQNGMYSSSKRNNTGSKSSSSLHRWNSKSTIKAPGGLIDRTNTQRSAKSTTTNNTTFLPELNSTPPMPTFQKPDMATPTAVRKVQQKANMTPTRDYLPKRLGVLEASPEAIELSTVTPVRKPFQLWAAAAMTRSEEDLSGLPSLPEKWGKQHDRAICVLDARNYSLPATVAKMRRTFPELKGTLTPAMIDKRLRLLDQNIEIDYWRIGLRRDDKGSGDMLGPPGSSAFRVDSNMTLTDEIIGSTETEERIRARQTNGDPSKTTLPRSQSIGNIDFGTATVCPVITDHFLTGYRSHISGMNLRQ